MHGLGCSSCVPPSPCCASARRCTRPRQPAAAADRCTPRTSLSLLPAGPTLLTSHPPVCRYPPATLAAVPDPTANIFIEKGIDSGAALLQRLQRLGALLDQQRRAARAAARAADAAPGDAGGAARAEAGGAGGAGGCARPVRLLVVDSVAHVCRDMGDSVGAAELSGRTQTLFRLAALLRCVQCGGLAELGCGCSGRAGYGHVCTCRVPGGCLAPTAPAPTRIHSFPPLLPPPPGAMLTLTA